VAGSAQSLYRRHRPRSFADVVGQEPVVRTLSNAVQRGQVHHAYLFVGSRGTGKTSMAKILASCLNCEQGPTIEPCGVCDSCRSIAGATSLDVIEMDAASNNSVEDVRDLRESVVFAPVSGRHKVYILDEAHMLSQAAWNAFLKTLEEPPPRTVFVLATTEAGKVPATVVDRCHRFDFQRPTAEQIATVLERTAKSESISIPPEALAALARSATGSFRDALGTLEQLVTYSGSAIALEDVLAVLGVADEQLLSETFASIAACDAKGALRAIASCADAGRDSSSFARDLEARARELLIVQTLEEVPRELSLTPEIDERLRAQAASIGQAQTVRLLDLLGGALEAVRAGADPRTQLELALVKASSPQTDGSLKGLLARVERIEQALQGGGAPAAPTPAPAPPTPTPPAAKPAPPAPTPPAGSEEPSGSQPEEEPPGAPAQTEPSTVPIAVPDDLDGIWPATLESVKAEHALLWAAVVKAQAVEVGEQTLTLAFPSGTAFHKRKAEDPAGKAILVDTLQRLTGRRYRISFELRDDLSAPAVSPDSEGDLLERLIAELDAEELPEDWLAQQKGGD
jgi:DNA polymerase III subunit gamma/tau